VLIKHVVAEQNRSAMRRSDGVANKAIRITGCAVAAAGWGLLLAACSADLSLNNVTLAPKPETLARKSDGATWGRGSFDRSVMLTELVGPDGQCVSTGSEPTSGASGGGTRQASDGASLGGISLQMTECEVIRRAGAVEKFELGANERGERSLVLTYSRGPWPGIYRFAGGRLVSIERVPEPAAEKSPKASGNPKKPAGS
jgi:hypothetical protein